MYIHINASQIPIIFADKIDFMRDITIYAIVVAVVVTVAYDGMVSKILLS